MRLEHIMSPIQENLNILQQRLMTIAEGTGNETVLEAVTYFFGKPGKFLRPALLMFSYGAACEGGCGGDQEVEVDGQTRPEILLSQAVEMIHSASLIHDDVIDRDEYRRGLETLNRRYGNKSAVLLGDVLFTFAFDLLSEYFPKAYARVLTTTITQMCASELIQAKGCETKADYLQIITGKTAIFMSACCRLGAMLAGASPTQCEVFAGIGMDFGMAFQIVDDMDDQDPNGLRFTGLDEAASYMKRAMAAVDTLSPSVYKESLRQLGLFVLPTVAS